MADRDPVAEARDIVALADPAAWSEAAGRLLVDLGFSLINSAHPGAPGGTNLLVAMRGQPTLRHFDPEALSFWAASAGRGRITTHDRRTAMPLERPVSWGSLRIIDRLNVENGFLTFGGTLRGAALNPDLSVFALHSPGPIVRSGGHSQAPDPLAAEIGAFFGRLMIPIDFVPGVEPRLAATEQAVLYAAFLHDARDRLTTGGPTVSTRAGIEGDRELSAWIAAESRRVAGADPQAWDAGAALRAELALDRGGRARSTP